MAVEPARTETEKNAAFSWKAMKVKHQSQKQLSGMGTVFQWLERENTEEQGKRSTDSTGNE